MQIVRLALEAYLKSIEMITVEISLSPKLIIVCLYIPPNCCDDYQQETLRSLQLLPSDCDVILTGDLNAPDINWTTYCGNSSFSLSLCNLFCSHNYIQMVSTPTHRQGSTLDLIITNSPHRLLNLCVDPTGQSLKSDHYLVNADIASSSSCTNIPSQGVTYTLNYSKADMPGLIQYLNYTLVCRSLILPLRSADTVWAELMQAILDSSRKYIPRIRIPSKPTPRLFISAIKYQLNRTHTLRRLTRNRPTQHLLSKLKSMETSLQTLIQSSKDEFLSNLVTSFNANSRKLFGYLNNESQSKFKPQCIVHDGNTIADLVQKASLFNQFFNSTFTSSNYILPTMSSLQAPTTQLGIIEFTETEVFEVLVKCDPTKAVGCDMISPFVINPLGVMIEIRNLTMCAMHVINCLQAHANAPINVSGHLLPPRAGWGIFLVWNGRLAPGVGILNR